MALTRRHRPSRLRQWKLRFRPAFWTYWWLSLGISRGYPIVSYLKGIHNDGKRFIAAGLVSIPITYAGGVLSMMAVLGIGFWEACIMAVFPFIPGDIVKILFAAFVGVKLNNVLE